MIPRVVASEKGKAQTGVACYPGVVGLHLESVIKSNPLESADTEGDIPVHVVVLLVFSILSRAGPVKSCLNLPAPSGKAKYSSDTDSEPVP